VRPRGERLRSALHDLASGVFHRASHSESVAERARPDNAGRQTGAPLAISCRHMPRPAPAIVLMYHRIGQRQPDPHGLSVSAPNLADHLVQLRQRVEIVPLSDLLEPSSAPRAAITFDDGEAELAGDAATILAEATAPATFFVVTAWVGTPYAPWQDRLATMLLGEGSPPGTRVRIGVRHVRLRIDDPERRRHTYWRLHGLLRRQAPPRIEEVLASIDPDVARAPHPVRSLDADELRALAANPLFEIGAHSMTHPMLSTLSGAARAVEIGGSREALEQLLGTGVRAFAYPFGARRTFGGTDVRAARRAGYTLACSAEQARVPNRPDPFRIPRLYVGNWDADRFAARLEGWLSA
jgi:peptidoglycan/xylan/chitin deacetylase (PgdA/CDA1 family)